MEVCYNFGSSDQNIVCIYSQKRDIVNTSLSSLSRTSDENEIKFSWVDIFGKQLYQFVV